jgi:hypothetical protein
VLNEFWLSLEYLPLAGEIGATAWFPVMESLHVLSITFLLGAILMVDLRVLGAAGRAYSVGSFVSEMVPWAVCAFVLATITGLAMFITRASAHAANPAFQIKMALLLLAGLNIAYFHSCAMPVILRAHDGTVIPQQARRAAGVSLFLWCAIMLAGRWVGHVI